MSKMSTALPGSGDSAPELLRRVEIRSLHPGQEDEWDRFVLSSPSGTFFHMSGWSALVERTLGRKCFSLTARHGDRISGVFPISRARNRFFGSCLVSSPLAVYSGICADDKNSYFGLLNAGRDLANRLGVKYLEMRNRTEPFPTSLPGRDLYVTFTQDLSAGADKLLAGLPRDTRYAVRKSQKARLAWMNDLTIDEFYEIYAQNIHRLGTPVFSKRLFTDLLGHFPKECKLFGVRKGSKAIAGVLCSYFRDEVVPYYGGSLLEYVADSPNNFMYWSLIAQSCAEGFRSFDVGAKQTGTGAWKFKSAWSMQVTEFPYRYQLIRAKQVPENEPGGREIRGASCFVEKAAVVVDQDSWAPFDSLDTVDLM
jgi:FemAB-related protein (PEP-CTERM system-associated)